MRTPILAVLALVFGLAAAYGVWHYMSANKPNDPEHPVVIVKVQDAANPAKSDIQPNTPLTANMFEVVMKKQSQIGEMKEQLVLGNVQGRDLEALCKRRSRTKLKAGQPILFELQTVEPGAMGIEQTLKPGEVAVTVQGNINEFGGGHLKPGMTVDVIAKFKDPNNQKDRVVLLFKEIDVLAVAAFEQTPADNQPMVPDRVLLRMTYPQSLRMSYFKSVGTISLLLRSRDTKEVSQATYDPDSDPILADTKKESGKTSGEQPSPAGTPQSPSQPQPQSPSSTPEDNKPYRIRKDYPLNIFDGAGVRTFSRIVEEEVVPTVKGAAGAAGKKDEPKKDEPKKEEPKKDEPKKDVSRGESK